MVDRYSLCVYLHLYPNWVDLGTTKAPPLRERKDTQSDRSYSLDSDRLCYPNHTNSHGGRSAAFLAQENWNHCCVSDGWLVRKGPLLICSTTDNFQAPAYSLALDIVCCSKSLSTSLVSPLLPSHAGYQLICTGSTADLSAWNVIETNTTVVCACIVSIKPALDYLFPERLISSARARWSKLSSGGGIQAQSRMDSDSYRGADSLAKRNPTLPLYNTSKHGWGASTPSDTGSVPLESMKNCRPSSSLDEPLCQ